MTSHYDFNARAATWEDEAKAARTAAIATAIKASVPLSAAMTVLEYGGATGGLARLLAPDVGRIVVADAAPDMVTEARRKAADARLSNVDAIQLDLAAGDAIADSFDVVVTAMVLHHVPDVPALLAAFAQVARPGGWLAICDLDVDPDGAFHGFRHDVHDGFDRAELTGWLTGAGFADVVFADAYLMPKDVEGNRRDFPIFLATARRH